MTLADAIRQDSAFKDATFLTIGRFFDTADLEGYNQAFYHIQSPSGGLSGAAPAHNASKMAEFRSSCQRVLRDNKSLIFVVDTLSSRIFAFNLNVDPAGSEWLARTIKSHNFSLLQQPSQEEVSILLDRAFEVEEKPVPADLINDLLYSIHRLCEYSARIFSSKQD